LVRLWQRLHGRACRFLSVDQVMFLQPIHVGELLTFLASVNYTGQVKWGYYSS
jgi:acyl-CoA hydrolase